MIGSVAWSLGEIRVSRRDGHHILGNQEGLGSPYGMAILWGTRGTGRAAEQRTKGLLEGQDSTDTVVQEGRDGPSAAQSL